MFSPSVQISPAIAIDCQLLNIYISKEDDIANSMYLFWQSNLLVQRFRGFWCASSMYTLKFVHFSCMDFAVEVIQTKWNWNGMK